MAENDDNGVHVFGARRRDERRGSHAADDTAFLKDLVKTDPALAAEVERRVSGEAGMRVRRAVDRKSKLSLFEVADLVARNHGRKGSKG